MLNGSKVPNQINVAIFTRFLTSWTGGNNYLRNLLIATDRVEESKIRFFLLCGTDEQEHELEGYDKYSTIIRSALFSKKKYKVRYATKISSRIKAILVRKKLVSLNIHVVSHSFYSGMGYSFKTLNWIPDFQHLHLKDMFDEEEVARRNLKFRRIIQQSDAVVFSSELAREDAKAFLADFIFKYRVLRFVSIPEDNTIQDLDSEREAVNKKYQVGDRYFFLPNQFWKHKNHIVVFKAIKILKDKGVDIRCVCTGDVTDYRNTEHMSQLFKFISDNDLGDEIHILGKIPYTDVFVLMRTAIAIINPSLFEGWSSTVEEAKSINQFVILSDIAVHREQSPDGGIYFKPQNAIELAAILHKCWIEFIPQFKKFEADNEELLKQRILQFGVNYEKIVMNLLE